MDMILLHDIQKSYGSHQVLKNVDLTILQRTITHPGPISRSA